MCHGEPVKVRGLLVGVISLLLPCGSRDQDRCPGFGGKSKKQLLFMIPCKWLTLSEQGWLTGYRAHSFHPRQTF